MRDFRMIRKFELNWKEAERKGDEMRRNLGQSGPPSEGGGSLSLEDILDELAEEG